MRWNRPGSLSSRSLQSSGKQNPVFWHLMRISGRAGPTNLEERNREPRACEPRGHRRPCWKVSGFAAQGATCLLHKNLFLLNSDHCAFVNCCCCCLVAKLYLTFLRPYGLQPVRLLCPWDSPGKNTGVGLPWRPPDDLPNPGIELGVLHLLYHRWILYHWATREVLQGCRKD